MPSAGVSPSRRPVPTSGRRPLRWSGRRCSWRSPCWHSSCWATPSATPSTRSCGDPVTDIKAEMDVLPGLDHHAPLLEVNDLHVEFRTQDGVAKAVNGANFVLNSGETLAILGESGCGKSVTAQAIMGILDTPPGYVTQGEVCYRGLDLLTLPENQRRKVRANRIAMIFQDALSALNPVYTVGFQLSEVFRVHRGLSRSDAKRRAIELLDQVNIPAAKARIGDYPHQFSGGMRQRVMIAMALALDPEVL